MLIWFIVQIFFKWGQRSILYFYKQIKIWNKIPKILFLEFFFCFSFIIHWGSWRGIRTRTLRRIGPGFICQILKKLMLFRENDWIKTDNSSESAGLTRTGDKRALPRYPCSSTRTFVDSFHRTYFCKLFKDRNLALIQEIWILNCLLTAIV